MSTKILAGMLIVYIAGLLVSDIILKREYDKVDKNDLYWNYGKILEQPFKYLKIAGGNITNIAFEQSANCSVRVLNRWLRQNEGVVQASVKSDTLFIKFYYSDRTMDEKSWLKSITPVRIFSPELLSVEGFDTKLEMYKLKQKCLNVNMSGRSRFEVESSIRFLDTLTIFQKDSSEVIFEMSPDYKGSEAETAIAEQIKGHEAMNIQLVDAKLQGNTLLDIGHAQIGFLKLNIADSSAVILSGGALRKFYQ